MPMWTELEDSRLSEGSQAQYPLHVGTETIRLRSRVKGRAPGAGGGAGEVLATGFRPQLCG